MYNLLTLKEWQLIIKPIEELIVQASIPDGSSRNEKFDFSIGMGHLYITLSKDKQEIIQIGTHDQLVLCAMQLWTDRRRRGNDKKNRMSIMDTLKKNGINNVILTPEKYFTDLCNYKFVISPEGNGIDCHRHYEALLSGCIPIIEDNEHMRRKFKNMPILYTNDYSEINEKYLEEKYEEMIDKEYDFTKLFITNFDEKNKKMIKEFSNFWCLKHQKKKFYL